MPLLGCIADDFTGATDLAATLVAGGMRATQMIGVPTAAQKVPDVDAVVVALKSRTAPVAQAVADSLAALAWLQAAGCTRFFHKYCSTFDSTDEGNIGPVADALLAALGRGFAVACPAFPTNGRTVYQGHLFVGSALLSESGMERHPLTPMTDPNLVRVLGRQTSGTVGLVPVGVVVQGVLAVRDAMTRLGEQGRRYAIVDALDDAHLRTIGEAAVNHPLITGGSGVALGLPDAYRRAGLLSLHTDAGTLPPVAGGAAVLAGSCSRATLAQIGQARAHMPVLELDALSMPSAEALADVARDWLQSTPDDRPVLIAASAPPERVAALQARMGREAAGMLVEDALARIARVLVARGVRRLVVAGGETSGAVVTALGVRRLRIGALIAPGVPWTYAEGGETPLLLALKSGNFGAPSFFSDAFELLGHPAP